MSNLVFTTAQELATRISHRQVSATEVLEAHLAQIALHNPPLNAIVTLDEERARIRAEEADLALARGVLVAAVAPTHDLALAGGMVCWWLLGLFWLLLGACWWHRHTTWLVENA